MSQTPQNKKPPMPCSSPFDVDPVERIYSQSQKTLFAKYNTIYFNNDYIQTYYLIFNEKCRVVARFNDYLILDDNTEFLKRFYTFEELIPKLKTIFEFYETYSRIFPNYMILQESECLYRNIRKKQKMIDAFNQIKKEEEENRERLKIGKKNCNSNNRNVVFDKNVQNSINKCQPSIVNCVYNVKGKNNERNVDIEDSLNSISISLLSRKCTHNNNNNNVFKTPSSSFVNEDNSLASIAVIIQGMDNKNVVPMETPKKKKKIVDKAGLSSHNSNSNDNIEDSLASLNEFNNNDEHNSHHHIQSALNNNRKFISHKSTASVPEINNSIKIINNYHKIIIPQGTTNAVININAHIYPNDNNNNNNIIKPTTTTVNNNTQSPSTTTKGSSTASKQSNTLTHNSNITTNKDNNNIYTHSNFQLSNPDAITTSNHIKSSSKIDSHKNITIKNFQTNMLSHSNNNNTNANSKSLSKCKNYSMQKNNTNSYLNTQSSVHNNKGNITTEGNIVNGSCNINNKSLSKNKQHTHCSNNNKIEFSITKSAFKSPEKILSLSKKKNITTTVSTTNHIKPIYKNKNLTNIQTLSALQNTKVNPFKTKFERKKSIQKHNTSNSLNANVNTNTNTNTIFHNNNKSKHKHQVTQTNNTSHHEVLNSFINQNSIFKKEIRTSLINADTIDNNNTKDTITNDKQYKHKHEHLSMRKYNGGVGIGSLRMFGVGFKHNHISTSSSNKLQQHSIEVNNYNCKGSSNNNNNACSQRKPANLKTPVIKKVVMSPKNTGNYIDKANRAALTEKVKLTQKCPLNREMIKHNNNNICVNSNSNNNPSKIIRSFNSKGVDANTTKMKFLRK